MTREALNSRQRPTDWTSYGASPERPASTLRCQNLTVSGHRTSIRLEPPMWQALDEICRREGIGLNQLATTIDRTRVESSLTAAIRVFVLLYFRVAATEQGHRRAGHGTAWTVRAPKHRRAVGQPARRN